MKMIQYNAPDHGITILSTMLFWWGAIRQYYKETNHIAMCLDIAYENLIDALNENN